MSFKLEKYEHISVLKEIDNKRVKQEFVLTYNDIKELYEAIKSELNE